MKPGLAAPGVDPRSLNVHHIVEEYLAFDFHVEWGSSNDPARHGFASARPDDMIADGKHASLVSSHESALPPIFYANGLIARDRQTARWRKRQLLF